MMILMILICYLHRGKNQITDAIIAHVPLAETFGYSTDLRSQTQGQGSFTMELYNYAPVPVNVQTEIIEERKKELVGV